MTKAQPFKELFYTILNGDETASRVAARQVRKLLYGSNEKREEIAGLIDKK